MLGGADGDGDCGGARAESVNGEGVGLGAAGGEDDVFGAGAESGGDGLAGLLEALAGGAAGAVDGGGIAAGIEGGEQRGAGFGAHPLGGVGIEVGAHLTDPSYRSA